LGKFASPALAIALTCVVCLYPASAVALPVADELAQMQMQIVHSGPTSDTFDRLEKIIKSDDKNTQAHYVLGLALRKSGYSGLADEQFKIVQQDHQYTQRILKEFRSAVDREDLRAAYEYTTFIRNAEPDNGCLTYLDALSLIDEGQLAPASAKLILAVRRDPSLTGASSALGLIHLAKGQYSTAKELALHDLRINPRHHQGNDVLGLALLGLHKYAEAEKPLKVAYETGGITAGAGRAYAEDLIRLDRCQDAVAPALVDMSCELQKNRLEESKVLVQSILARLSSEETLKGIQQADAKLKGGNYEWRMYETLSDVFDRSGEYLSAVNIRKKGLLLEPNYTRGYFRMAESLEQCHNYADAAKFYQKAYEHEPTNIDYLLHYRRSVERLRTRENDLAWRFKDWLKKQSRPAAKPITVDKPA